MGQKMGLEKLSDFITDRLDNKQAEVTKYSKGLDLPPGFMKP